MNHYVVFNELMYSRRPFENLKVSAQLVTERFCNESFQSLDSSATLSRLCLRICVLAANLIQCP